MGRRQILRPGSLFLNLKISRLALNGLKTKAAFSFCGKYVTNGFRETVQIIYGFQSNLQKSNVYQTQMVAC
jgi:hypothetical protein